MVENLKEKKRSLMLVCLKYYTIEYDNLAQNWNHTILILGDIIILHGIFSGKCF